MKPLQKSNGLNQNFGFHRVRSLESNSKLSNKSSSNNLRNKRQAFTRISSESKASLFSIICKPEAVKSLESLFDLNKPFHLSVEHFVTSPFEKDHSSEDSSLECHFEYSKNSIEQSNSDFLEKESSEYQIINYLNVKSKQNLESTLILPETEKDNKSIIMSTSVHCHDKSRSDNESFECCSSYREKSSIVDCDDRSIYAPDYSLPCGVGQGIPVKDCQNSGSMASDLPLSESCVIRDMIAADEKAKVIRTEISELKTVIGELHQKCDLTEEDAVTLRETQATVMAKICELNEMTRKMQRTIGLVDPSSQTFAKMFQMLPYPHILDNDNCKFEKVRCNEEILETPRDCCETFAFPQVHHSEDNLPRVIVCGNTEENFPKIVIADSRPRNQGTKCSQNVGEKLTESLVLKEKMVERFMFEKQLKEKDDTVDRIERMICGMQTEMRMLAKENCDLREKVTCLEKSSPPCPPCHLPNPPTKTPICPKLSCPPPKSCCSSPKTPPLFHSSPHAESYKSNWSTAHTDFSDCGQDHSVKSHNYGDSRLSGGASRGNDFCSPNRQDMQQKNSNCPNSVRGPRTCAIEMEKNAKNLETNPCQQLRDLREQYARLQDDYKSKLCEVSRLRCDFETMRREAREAKEERERVEIRLIDVQERLKVTEYERNELLGSKEQLVEQEQALLVARQRFREAQDELEELRCMIRDQASQLDDYRNKFLQAQQQVEEQKRQIDLMEMDNARMNENVTLEINRVKNQFQEKLAELAPLSNILKQTQLKLQENQQLRMVAEHNCEDLSRELYTAKEKIDCLQNQIQELQREMQSLIDDKNESCMKIDELEKRNGEMRNENERMKNAICRLEEQIICAQKRLDEKQHEVVQLTAMLDQVREDSARQVSRTKERSEAIKKSMQAEISEFEIQLAMCRAAAKTAQKERDEIRQKMQGQICNLNETLQQAQGRIRSLQGHVDYLKVSYSNVFTNQNQSDNPHTSSQCEKSNTGYDACDCNH